MTKIFLSVSFWEILGNFHFTWLSCFSDEHTGQRISLTTYIKGWGGGWRGRNLTGEIHIKLEVCEWREKSKNYCSYTFLWWHFNPFIEKSFPRTRIQVIFQQITLTTHFARVKEKKLLINATSEILFTNIL